MTTRDERLAVIANLDGQITSFEAVYAAMLEARNRIAESVELPDAEFDVVCQAALNAISSKMRVAESSLEVKIAKVSP